MTSGRPRQVRMKLLQWVHQKFQHSSIEPFKDLNIGNPCICLSAQPSDDDEYAYTKPTFHYRYGSTFLEPPRKDQKNYFSESEDRREEEETSVLVTELFHGFLTIGTLGSETSASAPATPTFATPLQNLSEGTKEVAENDLKLISYELERFLEAETKEGVCPSSARDSHVSTITLGGWQMEDFENEEDCATVVCPLQGYLLQSSVELPEMRTEAKKEKASLQELFDRTKVTENFDKREIGPKKKSKSAMGSMKKIIKKIYDSSKSSTSTSGHSTNPVSIIEKPGQAYDSVSTKKKHHKVLRMFQRRIHPEDSIAEKDFIKSKKYKDKSNSSDTGGCNRNLMLMGAEKGRLPQEPKLEEGTRHCAKYMELPQYKLNGNDLRRNEGHWIKTDADYLVLEL